MWSEYPSMYSCLNCLVSRYEYNGSSHHAQIPMHKEEFAEIRSDLNASRVVDLLRKIHWSDPSCSSLPFFAFYHPINFPYRSCYFVELLRSPLFMWSCNKLQIFQSYFNVSTYRFKMTTGSNDFYYSNKYEDDEFEYRHVHVTKEVAKLIPKNRLMSETEWRSLGIQQVHFQSLLVPINCCLSFSRQDGSTTWFTDRSVTFFSSADRCQERRRAETSVEDPETPSEFARRPTSAAEPSCPHHPLRISINNSSSPSI